MMSAKQYTLSSLIYLILPGFCVAASQEFYKCLPGISHSPGVTIPRGDIEVAVGSDPFSLYCHMNPEYAHYQSGYRSDRLGLFLQSAGGITRRLPSHVVNETAIVARYNPDTVTKDNVQCRIDLDGKFKGICTQDIYVGHEPLKPENFSCISENWSSLDCTWDEPYNPVRTKYELKILERGRTGRLYNCPHAEGTRGHNCYLDLQTNPLYRHAERNYQFLMTMSNALLPNGTVHPYPVDVYSVVRPGPANNITMTATSPHSITLRYKIDEVIEFFPPGFKQEVHFRSEFDPPGHWEDADTDEQGSNIATYEVHLKNLIPYAEYTCKVRMLSAVANETDERLWSDPAWQTGRTLSRIPDMPPTTTMGSFEIVGHGLEQRTVYIYWRQINRTSQNGPDFGYTVTEVFQGGIVKPLNAAKVTKAYAMFRDVSLYNYTFYVTSENEKGTAPAASRVFVPHFDQVRGLQPRSFTKIAYSDQLFEVSWLSPLDEEHVVNYTVFWCKSEIHRDRPYQCQGQLDWLDVSKTTKTVNISLPTNDLYQFAVAANTRTYSSGMIWATCTILHDKLVGKLKTVTVDDVKKTAMKVRWRLDCSERVGIVTGYKVSYCPIASPDDTADCIHGKVLTQETPADADHIWVTNLLPWTYYKVGVAVITRAGESELSDYLVNRTETARPGSPPREIVTSIESDNVVVLTWDDPDKPNGPIAHYQVRYRYRNFKGENVERTTVWPSKKARLDNLMYYTNYFIEIRACAVMADSVEPVCGKEWAAINVRTGYGVSEPMPAPRVTFTNSTEVTIAWDPNSFHHGGPMLRYEFQIIYQKTGSVYYKKIPAHFHRHTVALDRLSAEQEWSPDCYNQSVTNLYNFTIRAVTYNPQTGTEYPGQWSQTEVVPAYCGVSVPWLAIIIVSVTLAFVGVVATIYFCRCCNWSQQTLDMFKDVHKEIDDHYVTRPPPTITKSPSKDTTNETNQDWTEMQSMPSPGSKKNAYQRAASKDSMETLLNNPKRNASGTSDTTSGCDSGRSYDSDEVDSESDKRQPSSSTENVATHNPPISGRSASQDHYVVQTVMNPPQDPYSRFRADSVPSTAYSQMFPDGWQPRPFDPPPEGYSRVNAAMIVQQHLSAAPPPHSSAAPPQQSDGYSPFFSPVLAGPPAEATASPAAEVPRTNGYVTLTSIRDSPPAVPLGLSPASPCSSGSVTPVLLSPNRSSPGGEPLTATPGYISVAQANKMLGVNLGNSGGPVFLAEQHQSDPRAYSKVGVMHHQPSTNKVGPSSSDRHFSDETQVHSKNVLVISPKELQVETKAPYHKVTTTVDGCTSAAKSTMV